MSPAPPSHRFSSPLASFFRDLGLYRPAAHRAFEIDGIPMPDPIGDIWQAEEAKIAFEEGKLRSLSLGDSTIKDDNEGDDNPNDCSGSDINSDSDIDSDNDSDDSCNNVDIVFRNESPTTLLLCWMSETGEPHHFYRLEPSSHTKSITQTEQPDFFEMSDTDHLENTFPGHAFCLGYVQGEEQIARVQGSRSLFRRDTMENGTDSVNKSGSSKRRRDENNRIVDEYKSTNVSSIVVAGYRPSDSKPSLSSSSASSSSASSSLSVLSRRVQLVTITHVPSDKKHLRRRHVVENKKSCLRILPSCWRGRKRLIRDDDNDNDHDDNTNTHSKIPLDPRGWRVSARWIRVESEPHDTTDKIYEEGTLGGWPCRLEPNWSNGDKTSVEKLERDIRAATLLLPPHARDHLRRHCKIWVNRSLSWGPSACPVRGSGCCYHPSKEWLICNGLSGEKHMCVEINDAPNYRDDCDLWGSGGVMIHEFSHAYHHGMLPNGYENEEIQNCYELAMKEGLYDSIECHSCFDGDGVTMMRSTTKAYACSNAMEYFAELSAAFLGGLDDSKEFNKWYPYNRKQIQKHDPRAYSMLSRLWKVDATLARKTTKTK